MKYSDFEYVLSSERMGRYLQACGGDSRKAMTLYRYNLQLSQEMFTVISFLKSLCEMPLTATCDLGLETTGSETPFSPMVYSKPMPILLEQLELLKRRIKNSFKTIHIHIHNFLLLWSLECGNICSLPYNTVLRDNHFCRYSLTNSAPRRKCKSTKPTFTMN